MPAGVYQMEFGLALSAGMRDSLESNPLAAAVIAFVDGNPEPNGRVLPKSLYEELNRSVDRRTSYSAEWPRTKSRCQSSCGRSRRGSPGRGWKYGSTGRTRASSRSFVGQEVRHERPDAPDE